MECPEFRRSASCVTRSPGIRVETISPGRPRDTETRNRNEKGNIMATAEVNAEKIITDLKTLGRDAEDMLKATAGQAGDKLSDVRARLSAAVESAKTTCQRLEEHAMVGARATDRTIREHPYESIGVAFGIGLLIGVLVTRR